MPKIKTVEVIEGIAKSPYEGFFDVALTTQYDGVLKIQEETFDSWKDVGNWACSKFNSDYFAMAIFHCCALAQKLELPISENVQRVIDFALSFGRFFQELRG
jgi:hypothetical protein